MNQGDVVVYKCKGMYKVEEVGTLNFMFVDRRKTYYTLQSMNDVKDKAYVPTDDEINIRKPVEKEEALELIQKIDDIDVLWIQNEKMREREYRECINGYIPEDWIRVLKTLYDRTKSRGSVTTMDKKYQQLIENALYSELGYALDIPLGNVEKFIKEENKRKTLV